MYLKITLFLLFSHCTMFGAIAHGTLVKTLDNTIPIETILENSAIVTLDPHSHRFATSPAKHITSSTQITAYQITTTADILLCTQDQFFYDPIYEQWVPAKNISSDNHFLTSDLQIISCLSIEKIELNEPAIFYEITLEKPHTLFISQANILTHNFVPVVFGISFALGEGISMSGLGAGLGALGLGLWKKFGNKPELKFAQIEREYGNTCAGGSPEDPDKKKYPHGKYEDATYHHQNSKNGKSPSPKNGQNALDNSLKIKEDAPHRIGISNGKFVVLRQTSPGIFHGYTCEWEQLTDDMQKILRKSGWATRKGKILI